MTQSDERTLLRSAVTHGADAPVKAIERIGSERTYALMVAATSLAVDRKFTDQTSDAEIKAYTLTLPARFPGGGDDIRPGDAAAVIMALRGSPEGLEPLSHDQILGMMFLLTYAIMSHENLPDQDIESYIDDVISTADRM